MYILVESVVEQFENEQKQRIAFLKREVEGATDDGAHCERWLGSVSGM